MSPKIPEPVDVLVGGRVRALRSAQNLSQTDLGRAIGVTFQQVQKYESGANRISSSRLASIATYLGVPVRTFFDEAEADVLPLEVFAVAGARDLLEAYRSIPDAGQRRCIVALVQSMAKPSN